ncbi:MAG: GIY-YIG nuclease family protein [Draconibacterium sp.]
MAHFVYIIYSPSSDKFYVGETVNIPHRIVEHNSGHYHHASTKFTNDWKLFLQIKCESKTQALKFERFIKRMKSRKFYHKLKNYPDIVDNLLVRFKE